MSTSCRTPFVGVGTGRSGTTSLARIVGACGRTQVSHEKYQLDWYEVTEVIGTMIRDFREAGQCGTLAGDVGLACLPRIGDLRDSFRGMPVVCLHRDKESTVASFVEYGSHMIRPADKKGWIDRQCQDYGDRARCMRCFPMIDADSPEQAYGFYWEFCETLMAKVAEPVLHLDIDDMNHDENLHTLFDFLDIPESDRVYIETRRFWTKDEVQEARKEMRK